MNKLVNCLAFCVLLLSITWPAAALAAPQLVMLEQKACPWCNRWKQEIGVVYNKTTEGKQAPLRMVNIHGKWPDDLSQVEQVRFTPTFILVDNGIEVGRIFGYQGEEAFWFQHGKILKKLDTTSKE